MRRISAELVKTIEERLTTLSPSETPDLVRTLEVEQPVLFEYLTASGGNALSRSERELLFDVGITVWQIMKQGAGTLEPLSRKTLAAIEKRNLAMLEYLQAEPEGEFENTVKLIFDHYNQPEILRYVLDAIMDDGPGKTRVSDDNRGLMLYHLKDVIDALDAEPAGS